MRRAPPALRTAGAVVYWLALLAGAVVLTRWLLATVGWPAPELLAVEVSGREIKLLEPLALWALVLLPLIPALQWFTLTDFTWFQRGLNALLRVALMVALIIAAARPSISRFESNVCNVFLVDVSASVPDEVLVQARDVVQAAWDARGDGIVRLVSFAGRPETIPLAPGLGQIPALERPEGQAALTTDTSGALRLAYGLCPQDHIARATLITDGNDNRGDLVAEAATAADFGMRVSLHRIPFEAAPELFVTDVVFPDDIELSEPFGVDLHIYSNRETTARLSVRQNEFRDIQGREIELRPGMNVIDDLTLEVYEAGVRRFTFDVTPDEDDRFEENNTFVSTLRVEGRPRVLYVEGESRSRSYLERALDRDRNDLANFDLEVRTGHGFPSSIEEMINYDLILMSDVGQRYVSRSAMAALERYVRDYGGSLIMAGGEHSFGPGGFDDTPLEEMSPVTFDMERQRDQPSLAMMLVVDRSGSMDGLKLEMAKDAARAVVDFLGPQDAIGVIAFDTVPDSVVRLQSAGNRARIRADIGRIAPGGGTDIMPALAEAYIEISSRPARLRHVIVLTDGAAPWDGIADITSEMRADGITVSAVAVGSDADRSLLEMIAELGGGRFYATNDPNNIPQIFVQETSTVSRTNLVEEPFRPVPVRRSQATSGIAWDSVPYLLGYVRTRAKRRAQVLLETERGDPLLARWRLGLGHVAVFTSDVKNRWAVEWVRNRVYPQFWAQVIRDLMRVESEDELAMHTEIRAGVAHIQVDAIDERDTFINGLESRVEVTAPDGSTQELVLHQTAAGRYEAELELDAYGPYMLQAEHEQDGDTIAVSLDSFTHPFPDELRAFEPNWSVAERAVARTAGHLDPTPATLWDPAGEEIEYREELWPFALFAALALFLLDLLSRRVRMFGRRPVKWGEVLR